MPSYVTYLFGSCLSLRGTTRTVTVFITANMGNEVILMFPGPPLASGREGSLARKDGRKRQDTGIEQYLTELEIHPVPEQECLKGAEERGEGEDTRRKQVRDTYADFAPLEANVSYSNGDERM